MIQSFGIVTHCSGLKIYGTHACSLVQYEVTESPAPGLVQSYCTVKGNPALLYSLVLYYLVQAVMDPALNNMVQLDSTAEACSIAWFSLRVQKKAALNSAI